MTLDTSHPYYDLAPQELWKHFAALNRIPRPSGQEAAARDYVQLVATDAGAECREDAAGNLIVSVPARGDVPALGTTVAIQAHLDMVCEKRPEVVHDFATDPILPRRVGDLITTSGTTLGADNGIGAAAALALLTTPDLKHGPLELVFTVEEETGLHGAMGLDPALLHADMLINLDSEDPDELTVGCAGGVGTILHLPVSTEPTPPGWAGYEVVVSGLKGGHSGVQIHEPLANAIKLLAQTLGSAQEILQEERLEFRLVSLRGGSAHNAIPRDALADLVIPLEATSILTRSIETARDELRHQWVEHEPGLNLELRSTALPANTMTAGDTTTLLRLLHDLPHGVLAMSRDFAGKVETSTNLAGVETAGQEVEIATSSRSFLEEQLQSVQERIQNLGVEAGATVEVRDAYPGWKPDPHSQLLRIAERVYREVEGKPALVEVIHAGLECGVIVSRKPSLEAISFGPLIRGAHTPEESVLIPSVLATWQLLVALLAALA